MNETTYQSPTVDRDGIPCWRRTPDQYLATSLRSELNCAKVIVSHCTIVPSSWTTGIRKAGLEGYRLAVSSTIDKCVLNTIDDTVSNKSEGLIVVVGASVGRG
jgi:hypothetical protein